MIVERIAGNMETTDLGSRHKEKVYIRSDDLVKRIQRVTSDHGTEIGIRLLEAKDLCNGDILHMDEKNAIVVSIIPDRLIAIRPESIKQMGYIAHQIGNRHVPAQFEDDDMLVLYDRLLEELLIQHGVPYSIEERSVRQPFRHIGHSHG
jgi:urease accessory protein